MLVGRPGAGKEALVKLAAFFNGFHYKHLTGSIKGALIQQLEAIAPTPHILLKKINSPEDQKML